MTTWAIEPMRIARMSNDSTPLRNEAHIEEASQSYSKYDPVILDASTRNEIEIFANVAKASASGILGLTKLDATGVAGSATVVEEIRSGTILEANYLKASSAAFALTDLGDLKRIAEDSSGNWCLYDDNSSGILLATIRGLAGMSEVGDIQARVEFTIVNDYLELERDLT